MHTAHPDDPAIEALRGCAALLVVLTHYLHFLTPEPGLWAFASTGVDLFFVISGFVFAPYLAGRPMPLVAFFLRRLFRMYPLYLCALLVYVALKPAGADAWVHVPTHLLMAHTLQSVAIASYYNPAFWSLPPELEFYLLLPLLAPLCRRIGLGALLAGALAMHLLLVALADPAHPGVTARALATVHAPGLLIEFLLGALAWHLAPRLTSLWQRGWLMALAALSLALALLMFGLQRPGASLATGHAALWLGGNVGLAAAVGYTLLLAALAGAPLFRAPHWLPLCQWAGRLSYGTYLFHNAAPQWLGYLAPGWSGLPALSASLALTLLVAWLAHLLIEAPARRLGRRLATRLAVPPQTATTAAHRPLPAAAPHTPQAPAGPTPPH
jgi:peptidoglycan/LPS O-acetylase OafA/YrhL